MLQHLSEFPSCLEPSNKYSCMCVCTYHILFIHSPIKGHFSCFYPIWLLRIIAFIPFGCILRSRIADHMAIIYLIFPETTVWFSTVAASFYIPTSKAQSSNLSTCLPTIVISCFLVIAI